MTYSRKSGNALQWTLGSTVVGTRPLPAVSFCDFPVLSCSQEAPQASLKLQMARGQPGENPRPHFHHLPQRTPSGRRAGLPAALFRGARLRPGPGLAPAGLDGPGERIRGAPAPRRLPVCPALQFTQHPKPPRSSQLPWEEGPAGGARPIPWLQKPRLREVRRQAPGQTGGVCAAEVGPAPTSGRAARGLGSQEAPPPTEGPRGAALGRKARPTYRLAALHRPAARASRARFRVRPRDLSRHRPARRRGWKGVRAPRVRVRPPPGVASARGALRSARPPGPASRGSSRSAAAFLLSSRSARRPAELGGAARSRQGHLLRPPLGLPLRWL